jgi:pullulanase
VLSSQGISFIHAGTEFLRSKNGVENSFNSGDSINAIDWELKTRHKEVYDYVRELIRMRRSHPAFRMERAQDIAKHIRFLESGNNLISYTINGSAVGDRWKKIFVAFNGSGDVRALKVPAGQWRTHVVDNAIRKTGPVPDSISPYSAVILYSN